MMTINFIHKAPLIQEMGFKVIYNKTERLRNVLKSASTTFPFRITKVISLIPPQ